MALSNYLLIGPIQTVIAADNRDPHVSWQNHLDRTRNDPGGPRGGVDLVAPVGTPIVAPTAGWVRRRPNNGGAGNSMYFEHRDNPGWGDVFSHLSQYFGSDNQFFDQGQTIALSGDTGGVAAHLHRHLEKGGVRYNPWNYFSGSIPAGGGTTPIPSSPGRNDMSSLIARVESDGSCYVWNLETQALQHIPDTYQLGVLQRFLPTTSFAEHNQFAEFRKWYGKTLSTAAAPAQVVIDHAAIAKGVSDKVIAAVQATGVKVDASGIAAAVDSALADNFATIPADVADELADRVSK